MKSLWPTHAAISINMARRFGMASRFDRIDALRIDALMTIDGAIDVAAFLAYVDHVLGADAFRRRSHRGARRKRRQCIANSAAAL